jgi:hypothetical protein
VSVYDEGNVQLSVSFSAPENTTVVLQGLALEAYNTWRETGDDGDYDWFVQMLNDQLADHILEWTLVDDWNLVR